MASLAAAKRQASAPPAPTLDDIRGWPATVHVPKASTAFGFSRSYGYELAARGEFPARLIKRGRVTRVVTASIIEALEASAA
jgi:predicted DNA-binding transcriptional regulator AlpA